MLFGGTAAPVDEAVIVDDAIITEDDAIIIEEETKESKPAKLSEEEKAILNAAK